MKPPVLQTDWMNRVAFQPDRLAPHSETFFLHATDPNHPRALWVRMHLFCDGKERHGETQAVWFGEDGIKVARERWPIQRVQIDPERAGVGIGECNIQDKVSVGLVHGPDFAIGWDLGMVDECPGYKPLPADWLYKGRSSYPKFCTPHPSTRVNGKLEIWKGLARRAGVERIELSKWRGMQGHVWGPYPAERTAWVHCNTFSEAPRNAFFEAFSGSMTVGKLLNPQALLGRLWVDDQLYRFDHWKNLWGTPGRFSPTGWAFELEGPQGKAKVTLSADPKRTAALTVAAPSGKPGHAFANRLGQLTLELAPLKGTPRTLHSDRAAYEVTQPEPRGAAQTTVAA